MQRVIYYGRCYSVLNAAVTGNNRFPGCIGTVRARTHVKSYQGVSLLRRVRRFMHLEALNKRCWAKTVLKPKFTFLI